MDGILKRISDITENESITITALERQIGASKGVLSRALKNNTDIQAKWVASIVENYPLYSASWILTGSGSMLKHTAKKIDLTNFDKSYGKPIPLVTQMTVAGFGNDDFAIGESDVKDYYIVPKFKLRKIDFMIEITGSSMYPKYSSGDIIACTILRESKFIQWNRCHVIATKEQGILVKRIKEGSDNTHILAISDNKDFPPFEIPKSEITGIAIVAGVIRLE
ncbi:MAG TPA: S24 family peptidase [Fermentimonas sp.]|nr:S24 family peptidase [Fermentimonas sp.]